MVLKDYINYEQTVSSDLIEIKHYDGAAKKLDLSVFNFENSFSIIINIGNLITLQDNEEQVIIPPKSLYFIHNHSLKIKTNQPLQTKYTIINLKSHLFEFLKNNLLLAIPPEFLHIFKNGPFIFYLPLNIDIIYNIEEIYKINFKKFYNFDILELKAKSLLCINVILKKILFLDFKYTDTFATVYTKYFAVLKNILHNSSTLEESLKIYRLSTEEFHRLFSLYHPQLTYEDYLKTYSTYETL